MGWNRPGGLVAGVVRSRARCFMVMSACRYVWVERISAWPSHRAMTAVSTPA